MRATTLEAYRLFHEGILALSQVEHNGIRVDTNYVLQEMENITEQIKKLEDELRADPVYRLWRRRFGNRFKWTNSQLGVVVFDMMGYKRSIVSEDGNDEAAFEGVDLPFVKTYFRRAKLVHSRSILKGIYAETDEEGYAHCSYNLNIPVSYRGSCDNFNFQNLPVRNPEMSKLCRRAFLPSGEDYQIVETDFSGIEVRVAAAYNKDPVLIRYIKDPTTDMHRDMAMQIFILEQHQVGKKTTRDCSKNQFVFPQFYGSAYFNCARDIWNSIHNRQFKIEGTDKLISDHLREHGIKKLGACVPGEEPKKGTFEAHLRKVEQDFWGRRFKVYSQWKKRWYNNYLNTGRIQFYTGFVIEGIINRKQCINYPIQGSAFHCLLWSLTRLNERLRKYRMKSKIVGQIHDSIVGDVYKKELAAYTEMAHEIMTVELPRLWKWINVPLEVEAEAAPPGKSWYEKTQIAIGTTT